MIDVHCHVSGGDPQIEELLVGRDCFGTHPWACTTYDEAELVRELEANPEALVGEIGLDRLKEREISPTMRETFERQLKVAARDGRRVVLHGAKCWGQVVTACEPYKGKIPSFLFHGFSRSDGLIPQIVALNGFISVGAAVMNDHAVNYRELVKKIPQDRLLIETDRTEENKSKLPPLRAIYDETATLRGLAFEVLEKQVAENYHRFLKGAA